MNLTLHKFINLVIKLKKIQSQTDKRIQRVECAILLLSVTYIA